MTLDSTAVLGATTFGVAGMANLNAPLDAAGGVAAPTLGLAAGVAGAGSDAGLAHLPAVRHDGSGGDAGVGVGSTGGGGDSTLWARFPEKIAAAAAGPVFAGVTSGAGGGGGGLNGLALLPAMALCFGMACGDKAASEAVRFTNFVGVLSIAAGLASFILSRNAWACPEAFEKSADPCLPLAWGGLEEGVPEARPAHFDGDPLPAAWS